MTKFQLSLTQFGLVLIVCAIHSHSANSQCPENTIQFNNACYSIKRDGCPNYNVWIELQCCVEQCLLDCTGANCSSCCVPREYGGAISPPTNTQTCQNTACCSCSNCGAASCNNQCCGQNKPCANGINPSGTAPPCNQPCCQTQTCQTTTCSSSNCGAQPCGTVAPCNQPCPNTNGGCANNQCPTANGPVTPCNNQPCQNPNGCCANNQCPTANGPVTPCNNQPCQNPNGCCANNQCPTANGPVTPCNNQPCQNPNGCCANNQCPTANGPVTPCNNQPCHTTTTSKPPITTTTQAPTTTPPPENYTIVCPPGTILMGKYCQLLYCPFGTVMSDNTCIQIVCPEGTVWSGHKCSPLEPIVHDITFYNNFVTHSNHSRPDVTLNNVNNFVINAPVTINEPESHDDCGGDDCVNATEGVPDTTVSPAPPRCCTVMTPRTCELRNNRWYCYSRKYKKCGDFCTAPTIYLKPPRVYSKPNYVIMPPQQMDCGGLSGTGNCGQGAGGFDCSGCSLGIMQSCSHYCFRYSCPSHSCNFYDQQRYCLDYPSSYGCMEADGCYDDEWCSPMSDE